MALAALAGEAVVKKIAEVFVDSLVVELKAGSLGGSGHGAFDLRKGAQFIGGKLAGILPGVLAAHAPEPQRAVAHSAADDLLGCLRSTRISGEEISQINLDPKRLSSLIQGCFSETNASSERKENLADLSEEFSRQLIASLCDTAEFRIAFMRRCLAEFASISDALSRIEQRLANRGEQ